MKFEDYFNLIGGMPNLTKTAEVRLLVGTNGEAASLFGNQDENLRFLQEHLDAHISGRGNEIVISGGHAEVALAETVFKQLIDLARSGNDIDIPTINYVLKVTEKQETKDARLAASLSEVFYVTPRGKQIRAKTLGQKRYLRAMRENDIVFAIGPAGTGKTYLAVVMAVSALKNKEISRIILARPAVEAGEKLGFLPGDLQEKVNPYLRPLYDSIYDILGLEVAQRYMEKGIIEVAPLAYMRGRTLDDAFVILDEAQNTSPEQMKMFLTRLGFGSKAVITGDVTQIDLPRESLSGLVEIQKILRGIKGISFQYLTQADVVRHPLVQKIIEAYERYEQREQELEGHGT